MTGIAQQDATLRALDRWLRRTAGHLMVLLGLGFFGGSWLGVSPDPLAVDARRAVNQEVAELEKSGTSGPPLFQLVASKALFVSMAAVGRVPFPEAADNLTHLVINQSGGDYALWPGYLALSPTIRESVALAEGSLSSGLATHCFHTEDGLGRHAQCNMPYSEGKGGLDDALFLDLRTFFLYNPWRVRLERRGPLRRVVVFQEMRFRKVAKTPFPPGMPGKLHPLQVSDGLVNEAFETRPFQAYALWWEPAIPASALAWSAAALMWVHRLAVLLLVLGLVPITFWVGRRSGDRTSLHRPGKLLAALGGLGAWWCLLRGVWDLIIGLSQIAAMGLETTAEVVVRSGDPVDGALALLGWLTWRLLLNVVGWWICRRIQRGGRALYQEGEPRTATWAALLALFPYLGMPASLLIWSVPVGLLVLWRLGAPSRR